MKLNVYECDPFTTLDGLQKLYCLDTKLPVKIVSEYGLFEKERFENIAALFGVMAATPHLQYLISTTAANRMYSWFQEVKFNAEQWNHWQEYDYPFKREPIAPCLTHAVAKVGPVLKNNIHNVFHVQWPLPNVWLGLRISTQKFYDKLFYESPAANRYLHIEQLDHFIDLGEQISQLDWICANGALDVKGPLPNPDVVKSIKLQCEGKMIPFFFRGWGKIVPFPEGVPSETKKGNEFSCLLDCLIDGTFYHQLPKKGVAKDWQLVPGY